MSNWKAKRSNNFEQKKKVLYLNVVLGIITHEIFLIKNFQGNKGNSHLNPNGAGNKESINNHNNYTNNFERKEPIKC